MENLKKVSDSYYDLRLHVPFYPKTPQNRPNLTWLTT